MDYDPIKNRIGDLVAERPWMTKIFYSLLHLAFLRNWYVRREINRVIGQVCNRENLRVLDAGAGFGQFSYYIAKKYKGLCIEAVDIKDIYLERARRFFTTEGLSNRVDFSVDDLTELTARGPFDVIVCIDVMEHIEDDERVFRNFKSVLAPHGVVIINTPSDLGGSDVSGPEGKSFIGEHVREGYDRNDLLRKLREAGLNVTDAIYTYGIWGDIAWRLLVKVPMLLLNVHRLMIFLLPLYYIPIFPVGMLLNFLDMQRPIENGSGLLVTAKNSPS